MAFMQLQKRIKKLLVYFYGPNSKDICIRINRIKDKNHMIVSMDEKSLWQKFSIFVWKKLWRNRNRGIISQQNKGCICNKSIHNIILNRENQKAFLLKSALRQRCLHSLDSFSIVPGVSKRNKLDTNRKGVSQIIFFVDDMILYIKSWARCGGTHL